jgi:hypothetical protein
MEYVRPASSSVERPAAERFPGSANKTPTVPSIIGESGLSAFAAAMNCWIVASGLSSTMLNSCLTFPRLTKRKVVRPAGSSLGTLNA